MSAVRTAAFLACAGFLVGAALLPGGARGPDTPARAGPVFADPALPGLEAWLQASAAGDRLIVGAVAHRAGPEAYYVRVWGCNPPSWTDSILAPDGHDLGLPEHVVLMCVQQPPHLIRMGTWMNQTETWNGTQWLPLDEAKLGHGWVLTPGNYSWGFRFDVYDGPVEEVPRLGGFVPLTPSPSAGGSSSPASFVGTDPAGWHSIGIVLPVAVDAQGGVHAGTPRAAA